MKLPSRVRTAYARWSTWAQANKYKLLRDLPLWYLVTMTALPGLGGSLVAPMLPDASRVYLDQLLPLAPWSINVAVGLWLLAWWGFVGMSALIATAHGKALSERLFNSPPPPPAC